MGESRYAGKTDKYASVMGLFEGGIYFDQPDCKITDEDAIQSKVDRFKDSIKDTGSSLRRRQHRLRLRLRRLNYRRSSSNSLSKAVSARSALPTTARLLVIAGMLVKPTILE